MGNNWNALQQVYQKFLIGTEKCEILEINDYKQLKCLAQVAITHPQSLRQLREVYNESYLSSSLEYTKFEFEMDELLELYFKVKLALLAHINLVPVCSQCFCELLICCPKLEKVAIPLPADADRPIELADDDHYLATIHAIDPSVIEFYVKSFPVSDEKLGKDVMEFEDTD